MTDNEYLHRVDHGGAGLTPLQKFFYLFVKTSSILTGMLSLVYIHFRCPLSFLDMTGNLLTIFSLGGL